MAQRELLEDNEDKEYKYYATNLIISEFDGFVFDHDLCLRTMSSRDQFFRALIKTGAVFEDDYYS